MGVLFLFLSPIFCSRLDSLEMWVKNTFWGHYVPQESLRMEYYIALVSDDMPMATGLAAAISFTQFSTIDSALLDIAYCFIRSGNFSASSDAIERAEKIYGENVQSIYLKSLEQLYSGNARKAEKILKRGLNYAKNDAEKKFLMTASAMVKVLGGKVKDGFELFRRAENISARGLGQPYYEARLLGQTMRFEAVAGTLWMRQYAGYPTMLIRIRPIFKMFDGTVYESPPLDVEQIASLFGSPYLQVGIERTGSIVMPRWAGVPVSANIKMWIVHINHRGELDSSLVNVMGALSGYPPADSFTNAVDDIRKEAIILWFDSLAIPSRKFGEPFWRLVLSKRVAYMLADSSSWEQGVALVDSLIEVAPYISELFLWRGAFALFMQDYQTAFDYFMEPAQKESCYAEALYDAAIACYFQNEYQLAESLLVTTIECQEKFAPAYLALGVLNQDIFLDFQKAIVYYEKYLELSDFLNIQVKLWIEEMKK